MMTLAQKGAALVTLLVVDVALLAVGGVLFALAAFLASLPMSVTIATQ